MFNDRQLVKNLDQPENYCDIFVEEETFEVVSQKFLA
jgi:hypothetical protein